jgi:L-ascorbate metabolism protein UlaG (beta-lactamase superfamily)
VAVGRQPSQQPAVSLTFQPASAACVSNDARLQVLIAISGRQGALLRKSRNEGDRKHGLPPGSSGRQDPLRRPASLLFALFTVLPAVAFAQDRFPAQGGDIVITPVIHASIQIEHAGTVIHVDPWSRGDLSRLKPADLIVITDDVGHHLDVKAIAALRKPGAPIVIAGNGRAQVPDGIVLANGERTVAAGVVIEATAAYDLTPGEPFHPKGEANGYVLTLGGRRLYIAGVTECVPEVRAVRDVDIAFFPMNVPLKRMEPEAAIECLRAVRPKVVYPYHYDQEWVAHLQKDGSRPAPTRRGLDDLRAALAKDGIEVRFGDWYPRR